MRRLVAVLVAVRTELLEIIGVACLAAFAYFVWVPAFLLVIGVACILVAARWATEGAES